MRKENIFLIIIPFLILILFCATVSAARNPAAAYCVGMGYEYTTEQVGNGELGLCTLPDNSTVEAWTFLRGEDGTKYNYCATQGLKSRIISDCGPLMTSNCTACVLKNGSKVEVTKLMGIDIRESRCGDGVCGYPENSDNCPDDCESGTFDTYCDGKKDGRCDMDCNITTDADCAAGTESKPQGRKVLWIIPVILGIAAGITLLVIFKKRKKRK